MFDNPTPDQRKYWLRLSARGTYRCSPDSARVARRRLGLSARQYRIQQKAARRGTRWTRAAFKWKYWLRRRPSAPRVM